MARLGVRNATYRPARSVMAIAVMAAATFILVSVGAFRRGADTDWTDRQSGTGGYALLVETVMPIVHDPNSDEGRELIGLSTPERAAPEATSPELKLGPTGGGTATPDGGIAVEPFRVLPGDDASCLNLYEPRQPRIVGVRREFATEDRFTFAGTLDGAERDNPWQLLFREHDDGSVPVIADANSMTYVLHKALGDEIVFSRGGRDIRLRLVASLSDSVFQSELLMSEENFRRVFPDQEGYGLLMVSAPEARLDEAAAAIEDRLADLGADAVRTADRLAEFHRVENTYLSTFQTLGGLGLLLGTIGLAAVLLRNVLERRRELALLGAVGYGRSRLFAIVVAESALLLVCGVAAGAVCAMIATAPAASGHGVRMPISAGVGLLLFGVVATGLVSSVVAARAAIQSRLLDALRAE
jgi:hypothetical protein